MQKTGLFTKANGKLRVWVIWTEGAEVVVQHGQHGGKHVTKRYTAVGKNIGRANETTPEQQAVLEAEAKIVSQLKSGYFRTPEDAMAYEPFTPMKAQDYNKFAHKVIFPCVVQAKLNGQRLMIDANGVAWSKQGEPLELPEHWVGIRELAIHIGGLDGEVYAGLESDGGLSLQQVISAFRKPNENTHKLKYYVYDIPAAHKNMQERLGYFDTIREYAIKHDLQALALNRGVVVTTAAEADAFYEFNVKQGYEGVVYRNLGGVYGFGKRSYDLIKRKPRQDAEALVLSYTLDRNDEPVYTVRAVNGEQTDSEFKLKMKIPDGKEVTGPNYRDAANAYDLVGKMITYQYEELSDDNIPTKPVGIQVREVVNGEGRW